MTDAIARFADTLRAAASAGTPLRIRGGGTKDFYGRAPAGQVLDTRAYSGIVDYDPTELYVTVRAGTPLAELENALSAQGQWLAFEPPHFAAGGTVGGAIASGLAGPRRQAAGGVRDFVLGVRILDGRGDDLFFGGQVMKNVAGYDVSRLMAGAMGTLGLILEATLKVLPRPAAEATLRLEMPEARALEMLNQWGGKPLPVSASAWRGGELGIRLSGAVAAVKSAREKIGGDEVGASQAASFWTGVRDHADPFFAGDEPLWRISVPSTAPALGLQGEQLVEWGGALRWLRTRADARSVREAAAKAGGHATLFRGGDRSASVFHPLSAPLAKIHRELKAQFDPAGILNRGRMYPEF
ncbi:MAG: glycolate oxidase subunit GlcE [Burkholderiales bacterium]|jgi:glycolate oxidase FAD binding subunit|nr:glycolate oxidase subunit GlcE [Burkholderiales bacterium]